MAVTHLVNYMITGVCYIKDYRTKLNIIGELYELLLYNNGDCPTKEKMKEMEEFLVKLGILEIHKKFLGEKEVCRYVWITA
jgi:hypothetical protein